MNFIIDSTDAHLI